MTTTHMRRERLRALLISEVKSLRPLHVSLIRRPSATRLTQRNARMRTSYGRLPSATAAMDAKSSIPVSSPSNSPTTIDNNGTGISSNRTLLTALRTDVVRQAHFLAPPNRYARNSSRKEGDDRD